MNKILLLSFLFSLLFRQVSFAQGNGNITGKLTDVNGNTVSGATIQVTGKKMGAISNENGTYRINNIPAGSYKLVFSYVGLSNVERDATVSAGQATMLDVSFAEAGNNLGAVVVTTQKRTQSLIDIPVTVTAVDNQFLRRQNITEFDQLSNYVPGLQMQLQSPNNPGFVIRGITSDDGDSRVQPRVSVFQDGVSIARARGAVVELFDMERIEVVKGPQGTLFGRSAQTGAVHLIQNKPKNNTSGEINTWYGNDNQFNFTGVINTPIVKDKLLVRVAAIYNQRGGFIDNPSGGKLNGKKTAAVRGSFRYLIGNKTTADLILNYQYDNPPGTAFKSKTYAPKSGDLNPWGPTDLERGKDLFVDRKVYGATLLVNHSFSDKWNLTSITGARKFMSDESFDADGTAAPALWFAEVAKGDQLSQEFRFNYNSGSRFTAFAGASYFYENASTRVPLETNEQSMYTLLTPLVRNSISNNPNLTPAQKQGLLAAIPFVPLLTNGVPNYVTNIPNVAPVFGPFAGAPLQTLHKEQYENFGKTNAYEVFADGTYAIINHLNITAGVRGTYEDQTGAYQVDAGSNPSPLGAISSYFPNILFRYQKEG